MAKFLLRVQLLDERPGQYTLLKSNLLKVGFTKKIKDQYGHEYILPNGNYYIESSSSKDVVIEAVKKIAFSIDRNPMILLSELADKGMIWVNLTRS